MYLEETEDGKKVLVLKSNKEKGKSKNRKKKKPVDVKELIYLSRSAGFCKKDNKRKRPGTQGRVCRQKSPENKSEIKDHCQYLCCGRGHTTKKQFKITKCGCKFVWKIMDVVCKVCKVEEEISHCR